MSEKELKKFSSELDDAENTARIRLFEKAAKKYFKLAEKASTLKKDIYWSLMFLAHLYAINYVIAKKADPVASGAIGKFLELEEKVPEQKITIALPGSGYGEFETTRIFTELRAIATLYDGFFKRNPTRVREAIPLFLQIGDEPLFYSRYIEPIKRRVTGSRAALECEARAQLIEGSRLADPDPSGAIPHYMIAVRALRAARLYEEETKQRKILTGLRTIRTCWFCGRRVQGAEHLIWMESSVSPYFINLLKQNNEDTRIVSGNRIVACQPCFKAISNEADRIANIYYQKLKAEIEDLRRRIAAIRG